MQSMAQLVNEASDQDAAALRGPSAADLIFKVGKFFAKEQKAREARKGAD